MITYELSQAHPEYRPLIRGIIDRLAAKYPQAPLRTVRVYQGPPADRSEAYTTAREIALNKFWFEQPPAVLQKAARACREIELQGKRIAWHGKMVDQPAQLCTHEFGHSLSHNLPGWHSWASEARAAALKDPTMAPSGYSFCDIDEFWAESFAAYELGLAGQRIADAVGALLRKRQ